MNDPADKPQGGRHSLSDWLALHDLDPVTCRRVLDDIAWGATGEADARARPQSGYQPSDLAGAWAGIVQAMRDFLPARQAIIDDTFENATRIVVDRHAAGRKALTLDNGPAAYPSILYSYEGDAADVLVMAHEFGHAVQIRASRGMFVPPVLREVCAFLAEGALLSHALHRGTGQHPHYLQAWRHDNDRYFGVQRDRLRTALSQPDTPYRYSWNYPIARHLAMQLVQQGCHDHIWRLFKGKATVRGLCQELSLL